MTKKTENLSISPTGVAINLSLSGDKRPFEEILKDELEKRETKNILETTKSKLTVTTPITTIVDIDIRHHFTPKELEDFNQ
jgi:hypothetical protein